VNRESGGNVAQRGECQQKPIQKISNNFDLCAQIETEQTAHDAVRCCFKKLSTKFQPGFKTFLNGSWQGVSVPYIEPGGNP